MDFSHFFPFPALPDNLNPCCLGARQEGVHHHAPLGLEEMRAQHFERPGITELDDSFNSFSRKRLNTFVGAGFPRPFWARRPRPYNDAGFFTKFSRAGFRFSFQNFFLGRHVQRVISPPAGGQALINEPIWRDLVQYLRILSL